MGPRNSSSARIAAALIASSIVSYAATVPAAAAQPDAPATASQTNTPANASQTDKSASALPADAAAAPAAMHPAPENPFADVPQNSWAYKAIVQLHDDGVLNGYPDGYFKGKRPLTRYEMAVITKRAIDRLESDFSDASKAVKVNSDDIALVRKLIDMYGSDIAQMKKDIAETKAETKANTAQLDRANLHVTLFARAGLAGSRSTVTDAAGNELSGIGQTAFGTTIATQDQLLGTNANFRSPGSNNRGTSYETLRIGVDGKLSDRLSYETEFQNILNFSSPNAATGSVARLNIAALDYAAPNGFTFTGGRFLAQDGPIGLLYQDYFNGVRVGYVKSRYSAEAGYSFNSVGTTFGAPNSAQAANSPNVRNGQTLFAHAGYRVNDKLSGGIGYTSDIFPLSGSQGAAAFIKAPGGIAQELPVGQTPQTAMSVHAEYKPNKKLEVQAEAARHLGKDPYTKSAYLQPSSFWAKIFYGDVAPVMNNNYLEGGYIASGVNGLSAHNSTFGIGNDYQYFYAGTLNGYHLAYLGAHHYLANNASVGLVYQRYALNPGVVLPTAISNTNIVGNNTYLSKDQGQALFLQTKFSF